MPEPTAEELAAQITGDVAPPDHPAGEPEPEEGIDFLARAQEFEQQWEQQKPPAEKPGEGEPSKEPAKVPTGSLLDKILTEKYKGDPDLMAASLYEQWNSAARMHQELQELKQQVQGLSKPTAEPADELADRLKGDPEVQAIDTQLQSITERTNTLSTRNNAIILEANKLELEIATLRGQMKYAEEDAKLTIDADLRNKESKLSQLGVEFQTNKATLDSAPLVKTQLERQRKGIERLLKDEVDRSRRDKQEETEAISEIQGELMESVAAEIQKYGIKPGSPEHRTIFDLTRAKLFEYTAKLRAQDPDADGLDVPKAVGIVVEALAKTFKLTPNKQFAQMSREKVAASRPAARPSASATPAPVAPKGGPREAAQFAKERARAILGG